MFFVSMLKPLARLDGVAPAQLLFFVHVAIVWAIQSTLLLAFAMRCRSTPPKINKRKTVRTKANSIRTVPFSRRHFRLVARGFFLSSIDLEFIGFTFLACVVHAYNLYTRMSSFYSFVPVRARDRAHESSGQRVRYSARISNH